MLDQLEHAQALDRRAGGLSRSPGSRLARHPARVGSSFPGASWRRLRPQAASCGGRRGGLALLGRAGDQPRPALEGDVAPQPVQGDDEPVAPADQEPDMRQGPQQPGREAAELDPAQVGDRRPCGRWWRGCPGGGSGTGPDAGRRGSARRSAGRRSAHLLGGRCDARHRACRPSPSPARCRRSRRRRDGPGTDSCGVTMTRPARSCAASSHLAAGDAITPAAQSTVRHSIRSPPTVDAVLVACPDRGAEADFHPQALELPPRLLPTGRAGRPQARAGRPRPGPPARRAG